MQVASAHLFRSLLVESKSLGSALLKGREKDKALGPDRGGHRGPSEKPACHSCLLEALHCDLTKTKLSDTNNSEQHTYATECTGSKKQQAGVDAFLLR